MYNHVQTPLPLKVAWYGFYIHTGCSTLRPESFDMCSYNKDTNGVAYKKERTKNAVKTKDTEHSKEDITPDNKIKLQ